MQPNRYEQKNPSAHAYHETQRYKFHRTVGDSSKHSLSCSITPSPGSMNYAVPPFASSIVCVRVFRSLSWRQSFRSRRDVDYEGKHPGGRWGKKEKKEKGEAPVYSPSCVTAVGSSWTETYTEHVSSSTYAAECTRVDECPPLEGLSNPGGEEGGCKRVTGWQRQASVVFRTLAT